MLVIFNVGAQQSILLFTRFPANISVHENSVPVEKEAIWKQNMGGYLLNINNDSKTIIESSKDLTFKLSNENQTTKDIELEKGSSISVYKCMNNDKYCCEKLSDRQQSATKKIYAVAIMKKSALQNKTVVFESSQNSFIQKDDINIQWHTDSIVQKLVLYDVNEMEEILDIAVDDDLKEFSYERFKEDMTGEIKQNHKYVLKVITKNDEDIITGNKESSFPFELNEISFLGTDYYFPTLESVNIAWNTFSKITKLEIRNKSSKEIIYQQNDIEVNSIKLSEINTGKPIKSEEDYELILTLENTNIYTYPFVVLLTKEESNALLQVLD